MGLRLPCFLVRRFMSDPRRCAVIFDNENFAETYRQRQPGENDEQHYAECTSVRLACIVACSCVQRDSPKIVLSLKPDVLHVKSRSIVFQTTFMCKGTPRKVSTDVLGSDITREAFL